MSYHDRKCVDVLYNKGKERKGKERKSIYIAPFILRIITKRSDMDHTVLPANYAMPSFSAPPLSQVADIQLQLTTHLLTPKE